jgi:CubicO group peptidase (beta-lactamase class C family)
MSEVLPQTREVLEQGIAKKLHLGAQVFVMHKERVIGDFAVGESRPGVAMNGDTINPWTSAGKPVAAVAIAQFQERGVLDWDDRVTKFIPEFGANGKEEITIRHILTHTAGFRAVVGLRWDDPYDVAIAKICQARVEPRWTPGETAGYHTGSSWYVLAEIVRRLDGRSFDEYAREEIFLPLGMNDCWFTLSTETYRAFGTRIGFLYDTTTEELREAARSNTESDAAILRPGASARGPIRQLGRFYEMLANNGESLLRPETARNLVSAQRVGLYDLTFKRVVDWSLGFIMKRAGESSLVPYSYPSAAGSGTFGHSGNQSSCAFYDPQHQIAVAWFCNGMPGEEAHARRQGEINDAIYRDAGIA